MRRLLPLLECYCPLCIGLCSFAWVFALSIIAICHPHVSFLQWGQKENWQLSTQHGQVDRYYARTGRTGHVSEC
jgi:hypothetical protein